MPTGGPDTPQRLTPPQTRITQAWQAFWQQYRGDQPRKLIQVQTTILPALKTLAHSKRVR